MPDLVVVDASAIVELLVGGPRSSLVAGALASRVLAAPAHVDVEVAWALARLERNDRLVAGDLPLMVDHLVRAPITRYPVLHLTPAACALRATVAIADAYYVVLAAGLDAALLTIDDRLATACRASTLCAVAELRSGP